MVKKPRTHPPVFKAQVGGAAVREDKILAEPAKQFDLHPNQITDWKRRFLEHVADDFDGGAESRSRPFGSIFRAPPRELVLMRMVPGRLSRYLAHRQLWFPATVGTGGPRRFAEEVQAPPRWSARAFSAEQLAGMN